MVIFLMCFIIRWITPTEFVIDYGNSKTAVIDWSYFAQEDYYYYDYGNFLITGKYDCHTKARPMNDDVLW